MASHAARHDCCIVSERPTELLVIDAAAYREAYDVAWREVVAKRVALLSTLPAFRMHSHDELAEVASELRQITYAKGAVIPASPYPILIQAGAAALSLRDPQRKWAPPRPLVVLGVGSLYASHSLSMLGDAVQAASSASEPAMSGIVLRAAPTNVHATNVHPTNVHPTNVHPTIVLRAAPCTVLCIERKLISAVLGSTAMQAVLTQAEVAIAHISHGATRAAKAMAQHSPAAQAARAAAATQPSWRQPPTLNRSGKDSQQAVTKLTSAQRRRYNAMEMPTRPEVRAGQVITHRAAPQRSNLKMSNLTMSNSGAPSDQVSGSMPPRRLALTATAIGPGALEDDDDGRFEAFTSREDEPGAAAPSLALETTAQCAARASMHPAVSTMVEAAVRSAVDEAAGAGRGTGRPRRRTRRTGDWRPTSGRRGAWPP